MTLLSNKLPINQDPMRWSSTCEQCGSATCVEGGPICWWCDSGLAAIFAQDAPPSIMDAEFWEGET